MTLDLSLVPFPPTPEQVEVFRYMAGLPASGNKAVVARAGSGKTSTAVASFAFVPQSVQTILCLMFNKRNQRETEAKVKDQRVEVKTCNSLGQRFCSAVWRGVKPDDDVEYDRIRETSGSDVPDEVASAVYKLVGFAKNAFVGVPTTEQLHAVALERLIDAPSFEDEGCGGWTQVRIAAAARAAMQRAFDWKDEQGRISFNDQVWLAVSKGWVRAWYDLVLVDEAQDMNAIQHEMVCRCVKPSGQVCIVGDDYQAIYGFRGAVSDSLFVLQRRLGAGILPLTVSQRCSKAVAREAQKIVADFKSADGAQEGEVGSLAEGALLSEVKVGDAVLSRINAPLMGLCLQLIKRGVPARIEGRDIGRALAGLVRKLKARSVPQFVTKLEAWASKQRNRFKGAKNAEQKFEEINDQRDVLMAVADGAASVGEVEARLQNLFEDSDRATRPAVVFSSVHKAKGLEWDTVYLLSRTFSRKAKPGQKLSPAEGREEQNIRYVAITRAKRRLVWLTDAAAPQPELKPGDWKAVAA